MTPEDHMGDVIGDLNSRRGLVQEVGRAVGGWWGERGVAAG